MYTSVTDGSRNDGYGANGYGAQNANGYGECSRYGEHSKRDRKVMLIYLGVTAFCIFFELVYSRFSHGVDSPWMTWAFLYPAIGGFMTFLLLGYVARRSFEQVSYNAWNSGIATLTLGSIVQGVFEIAGTASSLQVVFTAVGIAFIVVAIVGFVSKKW